MIDFRNLASLSELPIEMKEAGNAFSNAISKNLIVRIRLSQNEGGFYLDYDVKIECVFLDVNDKSIKISGKNMNLEFEYTKYELNSMSGESHSKFYFYSEDSTLGITVNYK